MILFESTEKKFNTHGIGVVHPLKCLETKKKSLNGWYIECELPIKYKDIIKQDMILFVETKEKGGQPFRCNNIDLTDRKISITANHVMFDSERYVLDDVRPTSLSPVSFLKWINERTDNVSPFSVSSNVSGSGTKYFIRKTLLDAWKTTEEIFGGSFDANKYDVRLLAKVGDDDGFSVSYGKNIQSVSVIEDWSPVCTKVMPVGPDGLLLPEKYILSEVQYEQPYTKIVDFDIPTSYENESGETINYTNEELVVMLRTEATEYIKTSYIPLINYSVKSDVPQKLRIGDIIHVKHPILTIDTEVQEYQYDTISKRVKSLIFGNYERDVKKAFDSIKDAIVEANKNASGALNEAIKQSDIINKLNKSGLVYIDDNEILVLDKLPKEEADQVWRFGLGGLGFSSNGYEGPFDYALTQDGHFNIDFIQANSITVNKLAADVGSSLDLSSNKSIKLIVEDINKKIENIDTSLYHADISATGTSITRDSSSITLTAKLLNGSTEVETTVSSFSWKRVSSNTASDTTWNNAHKAKKEVTITSSDLEASANFYCEVTTAEWSGKTSSITIVDEVKSQVPIGHLVANQPDTQTLDVNGNVTPTWGLTLTPAIQLGIFSPDIVDFTTTWKRRIEDGEITDLVAGETVSNNVLSVNTNVLSNDIRSITYYCYMQYQYSTCMAEKTFTLVKDGSTGADGISIVRESTAVLYAVNSSTTESPMSGWITTRPERSSGQYIWQKMRIAYSDGTQTETDPIVVTGDQGDDGTVKSDTEPTDKTKMWLDTSVTPNILKYWNGTIWLMANNQQADINNAVNNATAEINKTISTTNDNIDTLNSSVKTISETVTKNSDDIIETDKKVYEMEQTIEGWKSSITKISTIEDTLTGAVMQKELSVYLRFYEDSGSPVVNLGSSESKTQNFITNEGMRVEVNGVVQTIINSAGLNTPQVITKKILLDDNHAIYTNSAKQLIIQ